MASGSDSFQLGATKESTYGTRAVPATFFEVLPGVSQDYQRNFYRSAALGGALWKRRRVQTTQGGSLGFTMEVPTAKFGFWLDLLHGASTPTPAQQGGTPAYLQTHSLSAAPTKSATIQLGVPETDSSTVVPFDYYGCMVQGATFAWDPEGVLTFSPDIVCREQNLAQTLATLVVPSGAGLFSFQGGSITIAGGAVADIGGSGSISLSWPLRTDFHPLGSTGLMAKPIPTGRPSITGELTADFTSLTHYNYVVNGTLADVVLTFEGVTISGIYKEKIVITIPDCGFTGSPPGVDEGPVQQTITFENDSQVGTGGDIPSIAYTSIDTTIP